MRGPALTPALSRRRKRVTLAPYGSLARVQERVTLVKSGSLSRMRERVGVRANA
jgi:hypothetical protein